MTRTFKDTPERKARRQRHTDIGAASLLGYHTNDSYDNDPADSPEHKQALADYIRQGGYVDFLMGRTR